MLRERLFAHAFVVLLLLMVSFSSVFSYSGPDIVPDVQGGTGGTEVVGSIAPRGSISVRERPAFVPAPTPTPSPAPFPTPVPLKGTPFPQATAAPIITPQPIAAPTPLPNTNSKIGWLWPVTGTITTYYSAAHPAIDIAAACYTPILAATSGTITYAGWKDNGGGNVISQQADNGILIEYNHLSTIIVNSGTYVLVGTPVGTVGATGWANGCHLHLSMLANGYWDNPLLHLP